MQMIAIEQLPGGAVPPLIRVGGVAIEAADIAREMQHHPADSAERAQLAAARALVVRELLRQRAASLALVEGDAEREEAVGTIAALLERELKVPEPSDADCRRFHAAHAARFSEPTRLSVRHILLPAAPDDAEARDAGYRLGETLIRDLQAVPERFTEFAQRHSACPSREEGGELGWLVPGQTVAELDRALQHLPEGLHDRPVASRYGWHVVSIEAREEGRALPYEAVAERVRHTLREQATRRALRHYLLALEAEIGVEGIALDDDSASALMQ